MQNTQKSRSMNAQHTVNSRCKDLLSPRALSVTTFTESTDDDAGKVFFVCNLLQKAFSCVAVSRARPHHDVDYPHIYVFPVTGQTRHQAASANSFQLARQMRRVNIKTIFTFMSFLLLGKLGTRQLFQTFPGRSAGDARPHHDAAHIQLPEYMILCM